MILVTGGAGFIGSALVKRLVTDHPVRVLDNGSRGSFRRLEGLDCEIITADIRNAEAVHYAMRGVETVVHLADVNGTEFFYSKPDLVLDVAVKGMTAVVDGCKRNDIRNLLVASSSEVYHESPGADETTPLIIPDATNPRYSYAAGKIIKEMMTLHSGIGRAVVFRPHNVYGPDMGEEHVIPQIVRKARTGRIEMQGDGTQTRAFTHIDDFTDGLMLLLENGAGVYHIGNPKETEIGELVRKIVRLMDAEVEIISGPEPPGACRRRCPDISKLKSLGFSPKITLDDGLPEVVRWYA